MFRLFREKKPAEEVNQVDSSSFRELSATKENG